MTLYVDFLPVHFLGLVAILQGETMTWVPVAELLLAKMAPVECIHDAGESATNPLEGNDGEGWGKEKNILEDLIRQILYRNPLRLAIELMMLKCPHNTSARD